MKRWFVLFIMVMLMPLAGCGSGVTEGLPANYVGVFKSIRTNNESITAIVITITADNGIEYEGSLYPFSIPLKGKWGEMVNNSAGLITYQLDKGSDTNFLDFYASIAGIVVSGTALRQ